MTHAHTILRAIKPTGSTRAQLSTALPQYTRADIRSVLVRHTWRGDVYRDHRKVYHLTEKVLTIMGAYL